MKSNKTDLKPNKLIQKRVELENQINRYWNIIEKENVIPKFKVRNYDLKAIIGEFKGLYDKLVDIKLRIQCANLGIKYKDLPQNANIINVYRYSALSDYKKRLTMIMNKHTIPTKTKIKYGKNKLKVTEELTADYLKKLIDECTLPLNKFQKDITDFNDNVTIEDEVPTYLTA